MNPQVMLVQIPTPMPTGPQMQAHKRKKGGAKERKVSNVYPTVSFPIIFHIIFYHPNILYFIIIHHPIFHISLSIAR